MVDRTPVFPITIVWDDGEKSVYESEDDLALNLEWFDSEEVWDEDEEITITDSEGFPVIVRVEKFETVWCERKVKT